jgi:hypothetical protein
MAFDAAFHRSVTTLQRSVTASQLGVTPIQTRRNGVSLERNGVSACVTALQTRRYGVTVTCNDVSAKRTDTISRREHVSLVFGFRRLGLGLGSSIRVREEAGQPLVETHQRAPDRPESWFLSSKSLIGLRTCSPAGDSPLS